MIGLITLLVLVLLISFIKFIAKHVAKEVCEDGTHKLNKRKYWGVIGFFVFALLGDEILGGTQFAYFCWSEPEVQVLVDNLEGRTVEITTVFQVEEAALLKVDKGIRKFIDVNSQNVVAMGYIYISQGGWLSRTIAFNGAKNPYVFPSTCSNKEDFFQVLSTNNMTLQR